MSTAPLSVSASQQGENTRLIVLISIVATIRGFLFAFDSGVISGKQITLRSVGERAVLAAPPRAAERRAILLVRGGEVVVEDGSGRQVKSLPAGLATDDPAKVTAAKARFKELKKEIKRLLLAQEGRLEAALTAGRSWPVAVWRARFVEHAVMRLMSARLLSRAASTAQAATTSDAPKPWVCMRRIEPRTSERRAVPPRRRVWRVP